MTTPRRSPSRSTTRSVSSSTTPKTKRDVLDAIADALLDRETVDTEELDALLHGRPLPAREKFVVPSYSDKAKDSKEKRRTPSIFGPPKPATG